MAGSSVRVTRLCAAVLVALFVPSLAACGGARETPLPAPTPSTAAPRFTGWWFSDGAWNGLHIVARGHDYAIAGDTLSDGTLMLLHAHGDRLTKDTGEDHLEFRLQPDGRHLTGRYTRRDGLLTITARLWRGSPAEVKAYRNDQNRELLAIGIERWHDAIRAYPPVVAVRPGGMFVAFVRPWPANPWTGRPVAPGTGPGDYRYRRTARGYSLTFFRPDGSSTLTAP